MLRIRSAAYCTVAAWLVALAGCGEVAKEASSYGREFVSEMADEALEAGRETIRDESDRMRADAREQLRDSVRGVREEGEDDRLTVDEEVEEIEEP